MLIIDNKFIAWYDEEGCHPLSAFVYYVYIKFGIPYPDTNHLIRRN